jgi:hypothetical protein
MVKKPAISKALTLVKNMDMIIKKKIYASIINKEFIGQEEEYPALVECMKQSFHTLFMFSY